jgi:choline/carnitine/betaine transport
MSDPNRPSAAVFRISVFVAALFVVWGILAPANLAATSSSLLTHVNKSFGWFYLTTVFGFLVFSLYLALGPFARMKLGRPDDEPDYSYFTWLAMLFSAGMGIGLVFWGVAEPLSHFAKPPPFVAADDPATLGRTALRVSFFHWGLHAWGVYTVVGLALAYSKFRHNQPGLVSATFRPLLGDRVDGRVGNAIDILATLATVFGVATSLGFGALQVNGGLAHVFGLPVSAPMQMGIIAVVSVLYMLSAVTGLDRGIRYLSNTNLAAALVLLVFVLFAGPTSFLLDTFTTTFGSYIGELIPTSFRLTPFQQNTWVRDWTIFYWAWWISWAPFVGMFIARVSRGRTIREFVGGVLIVPSVMGALWFSVFGGTALFEQVFRDVPLTAALEQDISSSLFAMLDALPLAKILSVLAILLVCTFFITSADSATFVLGMLTSRGDLNPPARIKLVWGVLQSSIAAVLLFSGGLAGLQTASVLAALPFTVVIIGMCVALQRALSRDHEVERRRERERLRRLEKLLDKLETEGG